VNQPVEHLLTNIHKYEEQKPHATLHKNYSPGRELMPLEYQHRNVQLSQGAETREEQEGGSLFIEAAYTTLHIQIFIGDR